MVANTGTYLDTPFHFAADGHDLSGIDLARVVHLPGVLVDVPGATGELGAELVESAGGGELAGRAVLFHTGWDRHWGTERYGSVDHPYLATAAAERLVEAGVSLVGIDSLNIDGTHTGERPIHATLLRAGVLIVEHLTGLDQLAGRRFAFSAVPPAVRGMGSFPVRAFAVVER
jgi:kynurenine formamidase